MTIDNLSDFLYAIEILLEYDISRDDLIEARGALLILLCVNHDFSFKINNLLNKIELKLNGIEIINWERELNKEIDLKDYEAINKVSISYSSALKLFRSRVMGRNLRFTP